MMQQKKVLIIDNDTIIRNSLSSLFRDMGCKVFEYDSIVMAESVIKSFRPEIVFLALAFDNVSPGLLSRIKEIHHCTVIVFSDVITTNDIVMYSSADEILVNPCSQADRLKLYFDKPVSEIRKSFADGRNLTLFAAGSPYMQ
ncbi:MAG: response regulator [Desulfocucumaceae bacterium]